MDFEVGIDQLDITDLITASDSLDGILSLTQNDGSTIVSVDADGGGDQFIDIAILSGVANISVDDLVTSDSLLV